MALNHIVDVRPAIKLDGGMPSLYKAYDGHTRLSGNHSHYGTRRMKCVLIQLVTRWPPAPKLKEGRIGVYPIYSQ